MQMLAPPIALKTPSDSLLACLDAAVGQFSQLHRVPFTCADGSQNLHAGYAGNITDDIGQLDVHLAHGLLHPVQGLRLVFHFASPLPDQ
ncbi:hypothetical protein D3C84_915260 [compost metagenome]